MSSLPRQSFKISLCRICHKKSEKNMIFWEMNSSWARTFEYCTGLQVTENMSAPQLFCDKCGQQLQEFSRFKKTCLQADTLWKNVINSNIKYLVPRISINSYDSDTPKNIHATIKIEKNDWEVKDIHSYIEDEFKSENDWNMTDHDTGYQDETKSENDLNLYDEVLSLDYGAGSNIIKDGNYNTNEKEEQLSVKFENIKKEDRESSVQTRNKKNKNIIIKKTKVCKPKHKNISLHWNRTECGLCDYKSTNTDDGQKHLIDHFERNDLECKLCNFVGGDSSAMLFHRYDHLPKLKKFQYVCPICCIRKKGSLSLLCHYRTEHMHKKSVWCPVCSKVYKSPYRLMKHYILHKKHYKCDVCGKIYANRKTIMQHLADHKEPRKRRFICDTCGMDYSRLRYLKFHQRTIHEAKSIKCTHCDKTFKSEYRLQFHMKNVNAEKSFVCSVCLKSFCSESALKQHEFWHTDDKPFKCLTCGKGYKAKCHMKVHALTHLPLMSHECSLCDKAFYTSPQLKRHQSVHTGIRKHKCLCCERSFHTKKMMIQHCDTKHNVSLKEERGKLQIVGISSDNTLST